MRNNIVSMPDHVRKRMEGVSLEPNKRNATDSVPKGAGETKSQPVATGSPQKASMTVGPSHPISTDSSGDGGSSQLGSMNTNKLGKNPWQVAYEILFSRLQSAREEFLELEVRQDQLFVSQSTKHASQCPKLNRYSDTHPYDYNRVKLQSPISLGDYKLPSSYLKNYVNASHVKLNVSNGEQCTYIVAQGPLVHTVPSYWQMVLEQDVAAIVMLSALSERGIQKCAQYLPSDTIGAETRYGQYTVTLLDVSILDDNLERRRVQVVNTLHSDDDGSVASKVVDHYYLKAWVDHGVPLSSAPIHQLSDMLQDTVPIEKAILVHCSAGIGRSGVFCVLDVLNRRLRHLAKLSPSAKDVVHAVDVQRLVYELRKQRGGMVQTLEQYAFCYAAASEIVQEYIPPAAAGGKLGQADDDSE